MKKWLVIFLAIAGLLLEGRSLYLAKYGHPPPSTPVQGDSIVPPTTMVLSPPLSDALKRVTKKFFGIQVSPDHSPVSPEKFSGYHTGVDFETYPEEQNQDVAISAVCSGPLLVKRTATGYGGVVVQQCVLDAQPVTIIYGHLKVASISAKKGDLLQAGQSFAVLGKGYSSETGGERKHLHLGIHKGTAINILGYVDDAAQLQDWWDATKYLSP